jgi:DNA modification methylase
MTMFKKPNTIYHGDCLDMMRLIPEGAVDFVFTDPPYNANKNYDNYADNLSFSEYVTWVQKFINEMRRISNNRMGVFISAKLIRLYWNLMPDAKLIIIKKGAIGTPFRTWFHQYFGLLITTLPHQQMYDLWGDIRMPGEGYFYREERFPNPGQTSLVLTKTVIENFTNPDDLIFDPFMGCGTTAVAAKQLGRRYLGSEISQKYCDIAGKRLAEIDAVQLELGGNDEQQR